MLKNCAAYTLSAFWRKETARTVASKCLTTVRLSLKKKSISPAAAQQQLPGLKAATGLSACTSGTRPRAAISRLAAADNWQNRPGKYYHALLHSETRTPPRLLLQWAACVSNAPSCDWWTVGRERMNNLQWSCDSIHPSLQNWASSRLIWIQLYRSREG